MTTQAIAKFTETHHQMMQWLVENPGKTLTEMGQYFGYTVPWLSQVINSDLFQVKLKDFQKQSDFMVSSDIPAKLRGLTAQAIDELAVCVEEASKDKAKLLHRKFILEVAQMGVGHTTAGGGPSRYSNPPSPFTQVNNFVTVSPETLARAREKLLAHTNAIPTTDQLPPGDDNQVGEIQRLSASVFESSSTSREVPQGDTV